MSHSAPLPLQQQAQHAIDELLTMQDMIRWSVSRMVEAGIFLGHGTDNPADESLLLVSHVVGIPWNHMDSWRTCRLTREERQRVTELVMIRIEQRVPAPYLVGEAWFCGLPYVVDPRVLIPRSPMAELIEGGFQPWAQSWSDQKPERIMDLCTGSGCIGIACAMQFKDAQVELLDVSFDALAVAEENIQRFQLEERVMALQSDLFSAAKGQYDLIVSNPPYVDADDMACLPAEFQHEPTLALAAGDDGLDLVRVMLAQARQYLTDKGVLVVEVGNSWPALAAAYPELPFQWQEFERGGHGVFVLNACDLDNL